MMTVSEKLALMRAIEERNAEHIRKWKDGTA